MIIIKLKGGLGNQIFQYCFAKSLSLDLNTELYIDLSFFNHGLARHLIYGLHTYDIKGIIGNYPYFTTNTLHNLIFYFKNTPIIKNIALIKSICNSIENNSKNLKFHYNEPDIFSSDMIVKKESYIFNNIQTPAYFEGYFQFNNDSKNKLYITEKFFKKYNEVIHEDLEYLPKLSDDSAKIVEDMDESNSILLHIRHGDYTGLLDFGLCSKEYYEKSMEIMASKIKNPKFFIFSDDIEGAKKLKIPYPHVFVDFKEKNNLNGRGNGELLKLMSSCKHFIIANSTLSWWAAFLGKNENKIIITPTPWFQNRRVLGVETIDNKKPIKILNNHKTVFQESDNLICKINNTDFDFKNISYEKNGNYYKITNINKNSYILLNNNNSHEQPIIKLSLESNYFNCLKILFKTKDTPYYTNENTFNIYYYENDDFEHYLIFPENTILNELKLIPGNPNKDENKYLIIKSLEIKEKNS